METPQQILEKHYDKNGIFYEFENNYGTISDGVALVPTIKAMEEYARQEQTLLVLKLKQFLYEEIIKSRHKSGFQLTLQKLNELYPTPD